MNVHVVGGGIGGLALAVGLGQRGTTPVVHESATELRSVGGGIALGTNAIAALDRLDLAEAVRDEGAEITLLRVTDPGGRILREINLTTNIDGGSYPYIYLHRAALQKVLVEELPSDVIRLGETCVDVVPKTDRSPDDETGSIQFEDGRTVDASVIVGADGIDSNVRRAIVESCARRETGTVTYRGVVTGDVPLSEETVQVWGPGTRVGIAPLGDGRSYWFATANGHVADPSNSSAVLSALRKQYREYPSPIPDVLSRTSSDSLVVTPLSDIGPLPRWHVGNVVLLGDAAHAPLPYLGQGAGQALEDAVALSRRLGENRGDTTTNYQSDGVIEAIERYVRTRKQRAEWVTRLSRMWWRIAQFRSPLARVRNLLVRYGPELIADAQQRWLSTPRY